MEEDTRPKVTMTKNELTKLLGIDQLMKRNSKNKTYDTMLDIICDFFIISKDSQGGVNLPQGYSPAKTETTKVSSGTHHHAKKKGVK